jgi:alpha-ketoglutarate-dependent taurine dioxygenase
MDAFSPHHADILDPDQQPRVIALLREHGLVTFTGITDRATLASAARKLMSIRPHRDAGPDGVTTITDAQAADPGYAAFTDAELIPHTDGTSLPDPPGLLMLTCQQPASHGGDTLLADAACVTATLARQHPAALAALSAPRAACFGTESGYQGHVCETAGPGRARIRLRLDDLATFSAEAPPSSRCSAP